MEMIHHLSFPQSGTGKGVSSLYETGKGVYWKRGRPLTRPSPNEY